MGTEYHFHETLGMPVTIGVERLNRFRNRLVETVLDQFLCWPKHVVVPVSDVALGPDFKPNLDYETAPKPIGTLYLAVKRCTDLINNDAITGDKSDPYVIIKVGQAEKRTPTIDDDLNPARGPRPERGTRA